ncbi:MAG: hypothetical protein LBK66_02825 [Spirochaetaceae bacterium]|jgi:hypothetical protein|nr:hypothetical protein [Spirochaetaceae bacterium]
MRFIFALYLFLHLLPQLLPAYGDEVDGVITELSVTGLKRTRLSTVKAALNRFMGQDAETLDLDAVYAAVLDTGILEPISISVQDSADGKGKTLSVEVREKWSIFPVPIFFVSSGQLSGGLFLGDMNAFGLNDKFFLGGMYSDDGWMLMSSYVHSGGAGVPGWMLSGSFARSERKDSDQNGDDIRRFNLDTVGASAGLSYPFTDILSASFRVSYQQLTLRDSEAPLEEPGSGARVLGMGGGFSMRKSHWDGYLLSEKNLTAGYTFTAGIASDSFHEIKLRSVYQESLLPGFKLNLSGGALYQPYVPPLFESSPQAAQVNILPNSFSARNYAGLSAGFEKYLFRISVGVLSAIASYQIVFSEGPIIGARLDHGAAASLVFYLSKLAIPAMGLGFAYNVSAGYPQFYFSVGMSL